MSEHLKFNTLGQWSLQEEQPLEKGFKSMVAGAALSAGLASGSAYAEMKPHSQASKAYVTHAMSNPEATSALSELHGSGVVPIVNVDNKNGGVQLNLHDANTKKLLGTVNTDGELNVPTQKMAPAAFNAIKNHATTIGEHFKNFYKNPVVKPLAKGAAAKRAPFNPESPSNTEATGVVNNWVRHKYDTEREDVPELEAAGKLRLGNKLAGRTLWRKNPTSGEREFLMHRGMSPEEHDVLKNNKYDKITSWTPAKQVADDFAQEWQKNPAMKPITASAWIPESQIHHAPIMTSPRIGQADDIQGHVKRMKEDEHEVFVKPHPMSVETGKVNILKAKNIFDTYSKNKPIGGRAASGALPEPDKV